VARSIAFGLMRRGAHVTITTGMTTRRDNREGLPGSHLVGSGEFAGGCDRQCNARRDAPGRG
jgi:hypothetical protein